MLFFASEKVLKERSFQIYETYHSQPQSHDQDLGHHLFADDALISSSRLLCHVFLKSRFITKHDRSQTIHYQVNEQKMSNFQWLIHAKERCQRTDNYRCDIDHKLELTELQDIVINRSSIEDCILNGFKVIIQNNDLTGFLGSLGTTSHGKTNICSL